MDPAKRLSTIQVTTLSPVFPETYASAGIDQAMPARTAVPLWFQAGRCRRARHVLRSSDPIEVFLDDSSQVGEQLPTLADVR